MTGIEIILENTEGWEQTMDHFEDKLKAQMTQVYTSLPFSNWIKDKDVDKKHCCFTFTEGYRYANPAYGPLTIVGSISDGGRFNIGGAQRTSIFPDLLKKGVLYLTSTAKCAKAEAAKPIGKHKLYRVQSKGPLRLWDLKKVIKELDYPNLLDEVYAGHAESIWAFQKVPTISQILADHLRKIGGDGLVFNSTVCKEDMNIALFFNDDTHVQKTLTVRLDKIC